MRTRQEQILPGFFDFRKMYMQIESPELDSFKDCVPEFKGWQIGDCEFFSRS